jgi:transcriptional regulator with PAS, ATPase and Fis domain
MRNKMKLLEAQEGKPIKEILQEKYEQFGSQNKVADELGVHQSTLWTWLLKLGLEQKTVLVPREYNNQVESEPLLTA